MDKITIMTAYDNKRMAKRFVSDGNGGYIKHDYDGATFYDHEYVDCEGIYELSGILTTLEDTKNSVIIRGQLKKGENPKKVVRRLHEKDDGIPPSYQMNPDGLHWIMVDFDKFPNYTGLTTEKEYVEWMVYNLPEEFQDTTYHYHWSSQAGLEGWNELRCHIWFWLEEKRTDAEMIAWARQQKKGVDEAPFRTVQPNYTANPIFEGVNDPVAKRSGLVIKERDTVFVPVVEGVEESIQAKPVEWNTFEKKEPKHNTLIEYLNPEKLTNYGAIIGGQGRTQKLFGLMISTITAAIIDGYYTNNTEVSQLAASVDSMTGNYFSQSRPVTLQKYAKDSAPQAIASAQSKAMSIIAARPKPLLEIVKEKREHKSVNMGKDLVSQEIKCGVPDALWNKYDISKHWKNKDESPLNNVYTFLSNKVTHLAEDKKYAVRNKDEEGWLLIGENGRTCATLNQKWGEDFVMPSIKDEQEETAGAKEDRRFGHVAKFVNQRMISIKGLSTLPIDEEFINLEGIGVCLNNYVDNVLEFDAKVNIKECLPILRMIKYSLCSEPVIEITDEEASLLGKSKNDIEYGMLMDEINGNEIANLRWVLHWLSRIRQNIGIVPGVALVLHGASTSIGKNTLSLIMGQILGQNMVKPVDSRDFGNNWTDAAVGGLWIHADDWENGSLKEHETLLKQFITNDVVVVNKRNAGNMKRINTSAWYITNNEIDPVAVDDNERRYTVIETTMDQDLGRELSGIVYKCSERNEKEWSLMLKAFNNLLCCIEVDKKFVSLPLENEHREELKEMNKGVVERWLDVICKTAYAGSTYSGINMMKLFDEWHLKEFNENTKYGQRGFGMELKSFPKRCVRKRTNQGSEWLIKKL